MDRSTTKFGGFDTAFMGDFRQPKPVGSKTLHEDRNSPHFRDGVNCFIELKRMHCFKNDEAHGTTMKRLHDGVPTLLDFEKLAQGLVTASP